MASEVSSEINQQGGGEEETQLELPPGFRFVPTDEEVVSSYLTPEALYRCFSCLVIADVDLNKTKPWDLPTDGVNEPENEDVGGEYCEFGVEDPDCPQEFAEDTDGEEDPNFDPEAAFE